MIYADVCFWCGIATAHCDGVNYGGADVVRLGQSTSRIQSRGAAPDVGPLGVRGWALRSASIASEPRIERLRGRLRTTQLDNLRISRTIA
jgi:hypothetical protein